MFLFFESVSFLFIFLSLYHHPSIVSCASFPLYFQQEKGNRFTEICVFSCRAKKNKKENGGRGVSPSRGPQGFKPLAATSSALATRASTAAARSLSTPNGSATVTGRPEAAAASAARAGMSSRTCLPRERK